MDQKLSRRESANSQTTRALVRGPSGLPKINQNHRFCRDHPFEPQSIWNKENWYLRTAKHCLRAAAESAVSWKTNNQVEENWLKAEPKWFWERQLHFSKFCVRVESPVNSWRELVCARPRHMQIRARFFFLQTYQNTRYNKLNNFWPLKENFPCFRTKQFSEYDGKVLSQ